MAYTIPNGYTLFQKDLEHVAAQLKEDLAQLRGAHLFITGGTGFFGIWLLESLLWASEKQGLNLRISVLSRTPDKFLAADIHRLFMLVFFELLNDLSLNRNTRVIRPRQPQSTKALHTLPTRESIHYRVLEGMAHV